MSKLRTVTSALLAAAVASAVMTPAIAKHHRKSHSHAGMTTGYSGAGSSKVTTAPGVAGGAAAPSAPAASGGAGASGTGSAGAAGGTGR
jgi:hypothetical protein